MSTIYNRNKRLKGKERELVDVIVHKDFKFEYNTHQKYSKYRKEIERHIIEYIINKGRPIEKELRNGSSLYGEILKNAGRLTILDKIRNKSFKLRDIYKTEQEKHLDDAKKIILKMILKLNEEYDGTKIKEKEITKKLNEFIGKIKGLKGHREKYAYYIKDIIKVIKYNITEETYIEFVENFTRNNKTSERTAALLETYGKELYKNKRVVV